MVGGAGARILLAGLHPPWAEVLFFASKIDARRLGRKLGVSTLYSGLAPFNLSPVDSISLIRPRGVLTDALSQKASNYGTLTRAWRRLIEMD